MAEPRIYSRWKVVVLSFVGAATFWFFSALGKEYSYRFRYPIEFVYNQDSLVAVQSLPKYVDVDVSGGGWDLFRQTFWFGSDPVIFELDNPAAIRYLTRPTILPILTDQLSQYRINFLFTDTLYIDIDRRTSKRVNLTIDSARISMEDDHRIITSIELIPDTAVIYGPTSFLDTLLDPYSVPLDVDEIDKDFNRFVKLGLTEDYGIYTDPPTVNLKFGVERFDRMQIATQVELLNFPTDSSVFVANPDVTVQFVIQESLREDFFSGNFNVIVDYSMINLADSTAPAIVLFHPENALDVTIVPDSLDITYVK